MNDDCRLVLTVLHEQQHGTPVRLELYLRNVREQTTAIQLGGEPIAFNFSIRTPDGRELWSRLNEAFTPAILRTIVLGPGEALRFSDVWDQRDNLGILVPPGRYVVGGSIAGDRRLVADDVSLLITP